MWIMVRALVESAAWRRVAEALGAKRIKRRLIKKYAAVAVQPKQWFAVQPNPTSGVTGLERSEIFNHVSEPGRHF
jgi:hypothetical protein